VNQVSPARTREPLYQAAGLTVRATTLAEEPEFVQTLAQLRATAFQGPGPWNYGLDEYDKHAVQVVCSDATTEEPLGALRLGLGDKVLAQDGTSGFYLHDFWEVPPGIHGFLGMNVESGRIWVRKGHPRILEIVQNLRHGTAVFLSQSRGYRGLFGTVALRDYPDHVQQLIVNYLRKYHPCRDQQMRPRVPYGHDGWQEYLRASDGWSQPEAMRRLFREVRHISATQPLLFLLYTYLRQGAELLADAAMDMLGRKVVIPLYVTSTALQGRMARAPTDAAALLAP
jgi:hypothetical protein